MGSKIYLADGDISTREIYQLPYSCQMVVLSACETGTGKFFKGEGMMSLARAFMQSGSPSVVTSLWKVDDRSTSELMVAFYKQLMNGKNKDEAMREAKLDFLASKDSEMLHHPYYWAAFIHIGDPGNIHFPGGFPFGALGLIGLLSLGLYIYFRKR
jgi:CHAT domain-containing protein